MGWLSFLYKLAKVGGEVAIKNPQKKEIMHKVEAVVETAYQERKGGEVKDGKEKE